MGAEKVGEGSGGTGPLANARATASPLQLSEDAYITRDSRGVESLKGDGDH